MDSATFDLISKIALVPAVIIAIVVVYRDSKQATSDRFDQQNMRIKDLTDQIQKLNERIDTLLTYKTPVDVRKELPPKLGS